MTGDVRRPGVIRGARIVGPGSEFLADDEPVDVHLADGRIVDIAPVGALPAQGEIVDAGGAWLVPGLWDHHVHAAQWALTSEREPLDDVASAAEAARRMSTVAPLADGRRVGTGFRDALWPDAPSLALLDRACGAVPTYLINADVHSVWLNSAALAREGLAADDGMLREDDAFEISRRLTAADPAHADQALFAGMRRLAARGVTGFVDFDMAWNAGAWRRRAALGAPSQRVEFAVYPDGLDRAIADGLRSGEALPGADALVRVGALKVITDGSLGTRTAACSHPYPDDGGHGVLSFGAAELDGLLTRATGAGLDVALHAIGDVAVCEALDAVARTGASGTIEHAQLVRHSDIARFARLGLAASIQPQHAVDDRDMADGYWQAQTSLGYPMATLIRAGARLRLGSDAPVAPLDPWVTIAAAVERTGDERPAWHAEERLAFDEALAASVRTAIRPGEAADLVLCGIDPRTASGDALRRMPVLATLVDGRITHQG